LHRGRVTRPTLGILMRRPRRPVCGRIIG
jgi:hypothetical protein